jgi:hypothetical protein
MIEVRRLVGGVDLSEGLGHAMEAKALQLIERGMGEHDCFS